MLFIAKVIVEKKYNIYIFKTSVQGGGMTGKQRNKDDRNNLFTMGKHQSANISVRTLYTVEIIDHKFVTTFNFF